MRREPQVLRLVRLCWAWLPVVIWMGLILWMSSRSDLPVRTNPQTGETIRTTFTLAKLAHIFEYGVLAMVLLRALTTSSGGLRLPFRAAVVATVTVCGMVGGLDELRQSLTPTREPRLTDIALDTASALAACLLAACWRRFQRTRVETSGVPGPPVEAPRLPRAGEGVGG
jgi:VanZ family protein